MATKKQKREAAMAKREAYMAEVKADGLKALARAKAHEAQVRSAYKTKVEKVNLEQAERNLAAIADDEIGRARRLATALYVGLSPEE